MNESIFIIFCISSEKYVRTLKNGDNRYYCQENKSEITDWLYSSGIIACNLVGTIDSHEHWSEMSIYFLIYMV